VRTCQTLGVKTLVVIRHSKSEQSGPSDFERQLTDRGMVDATEAGQWLASRGVEPDQALVSAAVRTQQTWEAVNEAGGWDLEGTPEDSLYEAGTESALDLIRETEDVIRTLVVVGHNPTVSMISAVLDPGTEVDDDGLRTAGLALHSIDGDWTDCGPGSAPLTASHTARAGG